MTAAVISAAAAAPLRSLAIDLAPELQAHEPPEARGTARDAVRLLVSRTATGELGHRRFADLPDLLLPGDLLVINNSATLPAAVPLPGQRAVHFCTAMPEGDWLVELRAVTGPATVPYPGGAPGERLTLPGGAVLTLTGRFTDRLWRARLSAPVIPYLIRHGIPIRYGYVPVPWPIDAYQTIFAIRPGSAEMPSAGRPFTPQLVTSLVSRGVMVAPVTLQAGVSSLEGDEDPYPEPYDVPASTARLVNLTRKHGGRVIAVGTTVVRALESAAIAASDRGLPGLTQSAGWTSHVVTPQTGVLAADGLLTGLHEARSTHLWMLAAFAPAELLSRCYRAAAERGYLWHEFGDVHLLLP